MINSLSIIFPTFNEVSRLNHLFKKIKKFNSYKNIEFIFVNDGSTDHSLNEIKKFKKENPQKKIKIITYKKNCGKGYALKKGIIKAKNNWLLTMDVDLSVNFSQIKKWEKKYLNKNYDIYFGSRLIKNSVVNAIFIRKVIGYFFNIILRSILQFDLSKIEDTQCGFKLYKKNVGKTIFKKLQEKGYIHDIELLVLIEKYNFRFKELPVKWTHKKGSKVNIFYDSLIMFKNLIKIKKKYNI